MAGFLSRLGRLAKAELNAFTDRFRPADADADVASAQADLDGDLADEPQPGASSGSGWPAEIRQAYAALEVPLGSDAAAVRAAHRKMLKRYHPDRHHRDEERLDAANELTRRLSEARDTIVAFLEERG